MSRASRTKCGRLVVTSDVSGLVGAEFALRKLRTTIGRIASNDIVLRHRSVSRTHAVVTRDAKNSGYVIRDRRSTNGVRVNRKLYGRVKLRAGDDVDLGWVRFRFVAPKQLFLFSRDVLVTPLPAARRRR